MSNSSSQPRRSRAGLRNLVVVIVAAVVALAVPAVANANEQGNIVTFGDSYTANPDQIYNAVQGGSSGLVPNDYPGQGGCLQASDNWPRQLSERVGAPVADWSCTAQTSRSMLDRIEAAINAGDLHAGTRSVVMAVGMNNCGPFGLRDGVNIFDPRDVHRNYMADIEAATDRIRSVAPNANIVNAGMLSVTSGDALCLVNVLPNSPLGVPGQPVELVESWNMDNQRMAAEANGIEFVDLKTPSEGHATCAPDAQRFVAGGIDTTTPDINMFLHPSAAGSAFIADRLAPVV